MVMGGGVIYGYILDNVDNERNKKLFPSNQLMFQENYLSTYPKLCDSTGVIYKGISIFSPFKKLNNIINNY